jgi:VWFA-related protein
MRTIGLAIVLCAGFARAQDQLVTFDVAIVDSHGRPITDITTDELRLKDDGKPERIAVFRNNQRKQDPAGTVPNQYSNRSRPPVQSATAILLDLVNLNVRAEGYVQGRLIGAVEHLHSRGYLLFGAITNRGLTWIQGFPEPPATVPDNGWTERIESLLKELPSLTGVNQADRGEFTFRSLDKVAQTFASFPGQKKVVWITDGVPREEHGPAWFTPVFHEISAAFATRGIALFVAGGFGDGMTFTPPNADMLTPIAEATGGKAYLDRDIAGAIAADAVPVTTYTVGFYPAESDGKKHPLDLTCTRRGAVVRAPETYVADPAAATGAARQRQAISRAVAAPFDLDEIGLRAAVGPSKTLGAVQLQIRIDGEDVALWRQDDSYIGHLSTTIAFYDAAGKRNVFNSVERELHFSEKQRQAAIRSGIGLADERQIPASATRMRIIVFDEQSNAVGSVTIPLIAEHK